MVTTETDGRVMPPYVSFKSILNLADRLKESGMPTRIDRSVWSQVFNGTYGVQVMNTLRFLGLLEGSDEPSDLMAELVEGDRKRALAQAISAAYQPIIEQVGDLSRATMGQLDGAFRDQYNVNGDTLRKARTFFTHAAQFAGIPLSAHITKGTRTRSGSGKTTAKSPSRRGSLNGNAAKAKVNGKDSENVTETPNSLGLSRTVELRSGGTVTVTYSVDLFDLDETDRNFVLGIIDKLRSYAQPTENGRNHKEEVPESRDQ